MKVLSLATALVFAAIASAYVPTIHANDDFLTSAGPIAFGPDGVLLVADPMAAKIHSFDTGDNEMVKVVEELSQAVAALDKTREELGKDHPNSKKNKTKIDELIGKQTVEDVVGKIAGLMGAKPEQIRVVDLAVNPASGNAYLSVVRGSGENSVPSIIKVDIASGELSALDLSDLEHKEAELPNAAESKKTRRGNQRMQSITDMALIDGRVYVAGLSNEEFASNLRSIPFPLGSVDDGASIEIYHGAHGKFETRSPIRTFAAYEVEDETNVLAAYTCTPLVRIPVESLKPDTKVVGTTVAELGNRNQPLDMVVYSKTGGDFILMANSSRGVMKISLADVEEQVAITERVAGTEGLPYETIDSWKNVVQLSGSTNETAVVIVRDEQGKSHLRTIVLP